MRLELPRGVVRQLELADAPALALQANNRAVWMNLTDIFPHPYTTEDADRWLARVTSQVPPTNFAITVNDELVGVIGFEIERGPRRYCAEIGYWLGQGYWGRGIATQALQAVTGYAFEHHELRRIQAHVFSWNSASMRVLEKCGYQREGWLLQSTIKDGTIVDEALYAKVRNEH
jgi:RimJ/RimL family protein N-acetyltransferase